jgi:hypothetical protein
VTAVLVIWHDAHSGSESWIPISSLDTEPAVVNTVGFLLSTTDGGKPEHVTVYQSRNEDAIDHVLHIPVKMVVSIKVLMDLEINTPDR